MSSLQVSRGVTAARVAEVEASALYEEHRQRVYRFCLSRLGDREEAHDAVQDTYAKAWLALRDGCEVRQPFPWLLTIARNVCASRYRARAARPVETPLFEDTVATITPLVRAELADLPAAVRALPEEQRRAFILRELRGCSYEEICETMGTSQASVAALLHRARRSVASALAGTGRRALVVLPFPAALRSLFEGGAATVATTAAATATGTLLIVGPPHVPVRHHRPAPPAPARVHPAPAANEPTVAPAHVGFRFARSSEASVTPTAPVGRPARIVPPSGVVSAAVASAGAQVPSMQAPVGHRPEPVESTQPPAAVSVDDGVQVTVEPETSGAAGPVTPPVTTSPSSTAADVPTEADDGAATKSQGNGPPDDAGSQGQGNGNETGNDNANGIADANGQGTGNGPSADPGSQGKGQGQDHAQGLQKQGNTPPADPGAQGNDNGSAERGGKPTDTGSRGDQGAGQGEGKGQ